MKKTIMLVAFNLIIKTVKSEIWHVTSVLQADIRLLLLCIHDIKHLFN